MTGEGGGRKCFSFFSGSNLWICNKSGLAAVSLISLCATFKMLFLSDELMVPLNSRYNFSNGSIGSEARLDPVSAFPSDKHFFHRRIGEKSDPTWDNGEMLQTLWKSHRKEDDDVLVLRDGGSNSSQAPEDPVQKYLSEKQFFHRLYGEQNRLQWLNSSYGDLVRETDESSQKFWRPYRKEIQEFLARRDGFWNNGTESSNASTVGSCDNCALNASCYDASSNPWHPTRCPSLFRFKPENVFLQPKCHNLSVAFLGDSRARFLFSAVLRRFYPPWVRVHR